MTVAIRERLSNIALAASNAILESRAAGLSHSTKANDTLVTSADLASHQLLMAALRTQFPGLPILTEETPGAEQGRVPDGPWLVADELDGTALFASGADRWGVMLALIDQVPTHAVIHLPDLGVLITAERGKGCWLNAERVSLRQDASLQDAVLGLEINRALDDEEWSALRRLTTLSRAVSSTGCTAYSTCELLRGITQAYLNLAGGKIWDFAAPALTITEGGGLVCSGDGQTLHWDQIPMSFVAAASPAVMSTLRTLLHNEPKGA